MEEYKTAKNTRSADTKGESSTGPGENASPQAGDLLATAGVLNPQTDGEPPLAFAGANGQDAPVPAGPPEALETMPFLGSDNITADEASENAVDEISALQDLITSGDDVELPGTTAGGQAGNEGTSFVTLNRTGDETLAQAGYDTTEQGNSLLPRDDARALSGLSQPTITQSDENIGEEDQTVTGNVLDNDSDPDDVLTVQSYTVAGDTNVYAGGQTAIVEGGSLTLNTDGSYSFTPADNYNGVLPVVSYTTNTNATDTLTITITPVSDLADGNESVIINEDTEASGNVLANAVSSDGLVEVTGFTVSNTSFAAGTTADLEQGALTLNSDGSYTFIPGENFNGNVPVVTYTVFDGINTDTSTLTIEVLPVSDLSDENESATINEDTQLSGNVLANAASSDGTPQITGFTVSNTSFAPGTAATLEQGVLILNSDGSYTFTPSENFNGDVPVVTYTVFEGINTDTSALTIKVLPVSDLTDENESVTTNEDTPVSGNVLANAASSDGTPEITGFTVSDTNFEPGTAATLEQGVLTLNSDGSYTFTPSDNFNGDVPVVTYTVFDGINTDASTLTIEVLPVSDLTDGNESVTTNEDTSVSGNVLANAESSDGTPEITGFSIANSSFEIGTTAILEQGRLTLNSDGSYIFTPSDNFNGNVPVVTYSVFDGINTDTSTLTIKVTPVSDLTDGNESVSTNEGTPVSGNILANAASSDGTPQVTGFTVANTSFAIGTTASLEQGLLTINSDGSYTFVPDNNFHGNVPTVTYTVFDGINTDTSTLSISVVEVNTSPVAADDGFSVNQGETVSGNVISHDDGDGVKDTDADGDGDTLVVTQVNGENLVFGDDGYAETAIANGILRINAQGDFTYSNTGFTLGANPPSFQYTVSDGNATDTATVIIDVFDAAPDANDDRNYVLLQAAGDGKANGSSVRGNIIGDDQASSGDQVDTSPDGTVILNKIQYNGSWYTFDAANTSFEIATDYGVLTIANTGLYIFTPADGMDMPDARQELVFNYEILDGDNQLPETDAATLTIEIRPPVQPLTDDDEQVSTEENTPVSGNLLENTHNAAGTPQITSFTVSITDFAPGTAAELEEGVLTINSDGSYTFVPAGNYHGDVPAITYTLSDGVNSDTSSLTISVLADNNKPVAADDSFSLVQGTTLDGNVITQDDGDGITDTDSDNDTLTVTQVNGQDLTFGADGYAEVAVQDGNLRINAEGDFSYSNTGFIAGSNPPTFDYTLSDGTDSDTATVTLNVIDTSPVANNDFNRILFMAAGGGKAIFRSVQGNIIGDNQASSGDRADTSPDGTVILSQIHFNGTWYAFDAGNTSVEIATEFGTLTLADSGQYLFEPIGIIDMPTEHQLLTFDYEIKDGDNLHPETDGATLTIELRLPETLTFVEPEASQPEIPETSTQESQPTLEETLTDGTLIDVDISDAPEAVMPQLQPENDGAGLELSDVLIPEQDNTLEQYLANSGENSGESEGENQEQSPEQSPEQGTGGEHDENSENSDGLLSAESALADPSVDELNLPDGLS